MIVSTLFRRALLDQDQHLVSLAFPPSWVAPRHPDAQDVQDQAEVWFRRLGVIHDPVTAARFRGMAVADYGGLPFPLASREGVEAATRFLSLWLLYDELLEGVGERAGPLVTAALRGEGDAPAGPPCLRGWWELGRTFRARMSPRWLERMARRFADWLGSVDDEAQLAAGTRHGRPPSLSEYLAVRTINIGVYPTLLLIELATGVEVPPELAARPAFQTIELLAAGLITIANDLFAFSKDAEQRWPNLVTSIAADEGLSLRGAFARAAALHRAWLAELLCAEEALLAEAQDDLGARRWLRGVHHVISGLTRWHQRAARYRSVHDLPDGGPIQLALWPAAE